MRSNTNRGRIDGKRVVVIGGAGAIGEAIVDLLAAEGGSVVIADFNAEAAQALADRLRGDGRSAFSVGVDIADEHSVASAFREAADRLGGIDILVNSAGIIDESPIDEMTLTDWTRMVQLNLTGVFLSCREVLPYLRSAGGGRIVNIASQVGQRGRERLTHYAAAKAGVIGLTKALAREVAAEGILVNAVAPGPIDTPFSASLSAETLSATANALPLQRTGCPEEVAPSVLLLVSEPDGNLYVGQTLGPNSGDVML